MTEPGEPAEAPDADRRSAARPRPAGNSPWTQFAAGGGPKNPAGPPDRQPVGSAEETMPWAAAPPTGPVRAGDRPPAADATRVMPAVPAAPRAASDHPTTSGGATGRPAGAAFHQRPAGADPRIVVEPHPPALIGRFVVALAGLLAAGCVLLGVVLVIVQVAAPGLGGTGIEVTSGPGWTAAVATLGVGVLGEVCFWLTVHSRRAVRITVATVVVLAVLAVLAFVWWR